MSCKRVSFNRMDLICYCIQTVDGHKTYIGATNNFEKRLKQHNRLLSGGAKSTAGHIWKPIIHVHGFLNRNQLLRFEWQWKHCYKSSEKGISRRISMLEFLLQKKEWENLIVYTNEDLGSLISCIQPIHPFE